MRPIMTTFGKTWLLPLLLVGVLLLGMTVNAQAKTSPTKEMTHLKRTALSL